MPTVKVNGIEVEVPAGTNMIEAAAKVGIEIPHYCYHPHLTVAGNCRMCLCDIEAGGRGPDIACNMQARDGLAIRTDTPQVKQMRKSVMEFLLKNHPLDCPICDQSGECRLQDYYMEHGQYESRLADAKVNKHKRADIGDHLVLDAERCVACTRCVRFGDEITGTGELRLFNRTDHTEIGIFPGERITHDYQGNLADICPVGAITSKDFRFEKRVWYLTETDSVCTGCATGCNIKVCHQDNQVFRYLPRRNDDVNKSWICDQGRMGWQDIVSLRRLLRARVEGRVAELDATLATVATQLLAADAGTVGFVLGTKASNEANWALWRVARDNLGGAPVFWCQGSDPGSSDTVDDLLIDLDKNANTAGVRALAEHDPSIGDAADLAHAVREGRVTHLVVLQDDVLGRLEDAAAGVSVVFIGTARNSTSDKAAFVLPAAHSTEQDASYVNRQDRVQRVRRALFLAGDSQPGWQLIDRLGAALGQAPGAGTAALAFKKLAAEVPAFGGMTYKTLGRGGQPLVQPEPDAAPVPEAPTQPSAN